MRCDTEKVFPGLRELVSNSRYERVDDAVQSFFTKSLHKMSDGFPFVITGDIPAMWLRDSTWQVRPLLRSHQTDMVELLINISKSQVKLFLKDPYANAFNPEPNGDCWHRDFIDQSPWVFERKFELDSWASVLFLARKVHECFGRIDHFNDDFEKAVALMLSLAKKEQNHDRNSYVLRRENATPHDSLSHEGKGAPIGYSGMVYSGFRPSDDACVYGYLIPSNLFFMSELKKLNLPKFHSASTELAKEIQQGVSHFALVDGLFAYEVDGLGNRLFIDDANVPSLLSLPYLEVLKVDDSDYQRTRAFVLSEKNPFYYSGSAACGLGSQHTPRNHVWPIAIAIQALTSKDSSDQLRALEVLEETDAGTRRMHESFDVDDPTKFTREWFSWSDMTYVDLVLTSVGYSYKLK